MATRRDADMQSVLGGNVSGAGMQDTANLNLQPASSPPIPQSAAPQITATADTGMMDRILNMLTGATSQAQTLPPKPKLGPPHVTSSPDTSGRVKSQAKGISEKDIANMRVGGTPEQLAAGQGALQQQQPPFDPNALALQMFFTSTIAPYLNQLSLNMQQSGEAYGQAMQQIQPNLNPAIQQYFNPAQRQAQVTQYANAMAGSAAAAPQLDQLMSAIGSAADMQRFLAYQEMQTQAKGSQDAFSKLLMDALGEAK